MGLYSWKTRLEAYGRTLSTLDVDTLHELWDTIEGELIIPIGREHFYPVCDRRMRLPLFQRIEELEPNLGDRTGGHVECFVSRSTPVVTELGSVNVPVFSPEPMTACRATTTAEEDCTS